jgi:hypothetical protein
MVFFDFHLLATYLHNKMRLYENTKSHFIMSLLEPPYCDLSRRIVSKTLLGTGSMCALVPYRVAFDNGSTAECGLSSRFPGISFTQP